MTTYTTPTARTKRDVSRSTWSRRPRHRELENDRRDRESKRRLHTDG